MKYSPKPNSSAWRSIFIALLFTVCLAIDCFFFDSSFVLLGLYVGLSLITFVTYTADKKAAQRGTWRTPESCLHLLSLGGGWPGALIARHLLHHKTIKQPFRFIFWITVFVNVGILIWEHTADGAAFFHPLLQELKDALQN